MAYEVTTPVFEGPFDLLLHLITREQVNIYDVSLSRIVDGYLAEMDRLQRLDLEVATEFLLIAATLIELKLRRLLPDREGIDLDEELALLEERDLLLSKLLEYRTFKEAAETLARLQARAAMSFARPGGLEEQFQNLVPDALAGVSPTRLRDAFLRALNRFLHPKPLPTVETGHLHVTKLSVAEAVETLANDLPRLGRVTFRQLTGGCADHSEVIAHFLALLELFKQGWVELEQSSNFGELLVVWRPEGPDDDGSATDRPRVLAPVDVYEG